MELSERQTLEQKTLGFIQHYFVHHHERQETLFFEQIFTDDLTLNEECHNMFVLKNAK